MKRKSSRRSQKAGESNANGVEEDPKEQNGDTSEVEDDQPTDKRRRSAINSRSPSKKAEASETEKSDAEESDAEKLDVDDEPVRPKEKKKGGKRGKKSTAKDEDNENFDTSEEEENQPTDKRRRSAISSKSPSKKAEALELGKSDSEQSDVDQEPSRSKEKKKGGKTGKKSTAKDVEQSDVDDEPVKSKEKKKGNKKGRKSTGKPVKEDQGDEDEDNETQYEVEAVLDEKKIGGVCHYLIRWKGYEEESDTWEPEDTLDCKELIEKYNKTKKKTKSKKTSHKKEKKEDKEPDWDENEDFEVDRILDVYFRRDGKREFLVSWKGYGATENSWEPEENMDCKDLITKFMSKVSKAREIDEKELRINRKQVQRFTLSTQESSRRLSRRFRGKERVQYHDAE